MSGSVLAAAVVVVAACGGSGDAGEAPTITATEAATTGSSSGFSVEQARDFQAFDLYWLGDSFDGLPLLNIEYYPSYGGTNTQPPVASFFWPDLRRLRPERS